MTAVMFYDVSKRHDSTSRHTFLGRTATVARCTAAPIAYERPRYAGDSLDLVDEEMTAHRLSADDQLPPGHCAKVGAGNTCHDK
jgi:hypothetical protein